uniref:Uncharacterized protein n=1 Tax=Amphora coffeiformis TaxID=265554 RepID=A0A7S3L2E2_9STRA
MDPYNNNSINYNNNDRNMQDQDLVEQPHFRSMTMALPSRAPLLRETTTPSTHKTNMTEHRATNTGNDDVSTWASVDKLVTLSPFHPLETSHVKFPRWHLATALSRITSALYHTHQCTVQYDTHHLGATCHALRDGVVFGLSFFLDKDDDAVIFEVQRISGDSFAFHKYYARPLLRLVVEQEQTQHHQQQQGTPSANDGSGVLLDQVVMPKSPSSHRQHHHPGDENIHEALQIVCDMMLGNNGVHARNLGLESLLALTNPACAGWNTARTVVQTLLDCEPNAAQSLPLLLETLQCCLVQECNVQALQVWVQIWQIMATMSENETETTMQTPTTVTSAAMIQHLLSLVEQHHAHSHLPQQHQQNPHVVTLALQGLAALCGIDPSLRRGLAVSTSCHAVAISWPVLVQQVQATAHYADMEHASQQLLQMMCT